jgi:hypothetical protein
LICEFPQPRLEEIFNEYGQPSLKHTVTNVRGIGKTYSDLDNLISSADFSKFMVEISGIEDLIYDPTYYGGGTHNNLSGQGMDPHVDFNYLDIPNVGEMHRRINAIVYLNEEWQEDWGGALDLHENPWDPVNDKVIRILPKKNRLVLFETNEFSWHGFLPVTPQLPSGISRKSFALYMYSNERPREEICPKHGTFYVPRIPVEILEVGVKVTPGDCNRLLRARSHALQMINNLYKREMQLNDYIKDRYFEIKCLKEQLASPESINFPLEITNWGPRSAKVGTISNKQPDGSMGIWIEVKSTKGLGEAQLMFGGQSAKVTSVMEKHVNAAISIEQINQSGNKEVVIKQISTGKTYPVGIFIVESAN